jgi:hypothetical protein
MKETFRTRNGSIEWREYTCEMVCPNYNAIADYYSLDIADNICHFDIECVRVPGPNGFPIKNRFKPMLVGMAYWKDWDKPEMTLNTFFGDNEAELIELIDDAFGLFRYALYDGNVTRDFDASVLEGKFVSYRKPFWNKTPEWPVLEHIDGYFVNIRRDIRDMKRLVRSEAIENGSKMTELWRTNKELVIRHNLLDLVDIGYRLEQRFPK